uniref:Uncharacterized protein n=1 Tax=Romanomermis culicivorax TaxID=13658 RepID=A0A915ICD8_ROMCU
MHPQGREFSIRFFYSFSQKYRRLSSSSLELKSPSLEKRFLTMNFKKNSLHFVQRYQKSLYGAKNVCLVQKETWCSIEGTAAAAAVDKLVAVAGNN